MPVKCTSCEWKGTERELDPEGGSCPECGAGVMGT